MLQRLADVAAAALQQEREQQPSTNVEHATTRLRSSVLSDSSPAPAFLNVADLAIKLDEVEKEAAEAAEVATVEEKEAEDAARRAEEEWQVKLMSAHSGFTLILGLISD